MFEKRLGFKAEGEQRNAYTQRFAGQVLGLGTDLYKKLID